MSDFLGEQDSFRFLVEESFDALQANGQMFEFGALREVTTRRPDHFRMEERRRDGTDRRVTFDGRKLSTWFSSENAWSAVEHPGTIEQAIHYQTVELDARAPLSDLLASDLHAAVSPQVEQGLLVGEARIGGRDCTHLAFLTEDVGVQIWIDAGEQPLPRRIVFSYRQAEGAAARAHAPAAARWRRLPGVVHHTFTHFHLELGMLAADIDDAAPAEGVWCPPERFGDHALPTVMKKVVRHAWRGGRGRPGAGPRLPPVIDPDQGRSRRGGTVS